MKKFLFSAAMLAFAISCNNPSTQTTNSTAQSPEQINIANGEKVYQAIESGNTSPIDSLIAPDIVDHDAPNGMEVKGKDSVLNMLANIHNHLNNIKFDVIKSAANGDYVFSMVHVTGTSADSAMGMPGQPIDERGVDVIKLNSDHQITEHWGFTEDQQVHKMMEMAGKK